MNFDNHPQTLIWFRDRYKAGELELKPPFQRQPVWISKQKSSLIESILLKLPIPEVYIQQSLVSHEGEQKAMYYVVDGQQRIRTVLQFMGADKMESEAEWNGFSLSKLPDDSEFKDVNFAGLTPAQRDEFLNYNFAVRVLKGADDAAVRDMFKRLNKFLTKLNDQELRNATFTGPFIRVATEIAEKPYWVQQGLVSPAQVRRMKDIEFASELLIGVLHGPQGGNARSIDEYYEQYDDYDDEFPGQKLAVRRFEETLSIVSAVMPAADTSRFRANRTDFYSLFVAVAQLGREAAFPKTQYTPIQKKLRVFELAVDDRLANEKASAPISIVKYVRAVEKGANDKRRRADRHACLTALLQPFVKHRKAAKPVARTAN